MTHESISFRGMRAWAPGVEITGCHVAGGDIDLHNGCDLLGFGLRRTPRLPEFSLNFRRDDGGAFELVFGGVVDLVVVQDPDDWFLGSADFDPKVLGPYASFDGLDYTDRGDGQARFVVHSALGTVQFKASSVSFLPTSNGLA